MWLLSQIPAPASGSIENWLLSAAALASMAVLAKKLFVRKPAEPEFVTKTEFYQEMKEVRDKIETGFHETRKFVAMNDEMLLRNGEVRTASIHRRLMNVEEAVARLDE